MFAPPPPPTHPAHLLLLLLPGTLRVGSPLLQPLCRSSLLQHAHHAVFVGLRSLQQHSGHPQGAVQLALQLKVGRHSIALLLQLLPPLLHARAGGETAPVRSGQGQEGQTHEQR